MWCDCCMEVPVTLCRVPPVKTASTIKMVYLIVSRVSPTVLRQVPALNESVAATDELTRACAIWNDRFASLDVP